MEGGEGGCLIICSCFRFLVLAPVRKSTAHSLNSSGGLFTCCIVWARRFAYSNSPCLENNSINKSSLSLPGNIFAVTPDGLLSSLFVFVNPVHNSSKLKILQIHIPACFLDLCKPLSYSESPETPHPTLANRKQGRS